MWIEAQSHDLIKRNLLPNFEHSLTPFPAATTVDDDNEEEEQLVQVNPDNDETDETSIHNSSVAS